MPYDTVMPLPPHGRLLGIDFGTVRVGVAYCDPDRIVASPLTTIQRSTPDAELAAYRKIVAVEKVVGIVVGLPISLNGTEGPKAKETRAYGEWLHDNLGLPLDYWDERFSSAIADDAMQLGKLNPKKRKEQRDRLAAQVMLQGYLEGQRQNSLTNRSSN
jgi:putative Holliday junction resolvase